MISKNKNALESRTQTYKRITDGLRKYFEQDTPDAMRLVQEAKSTEIWKEKWSSWSEYCEKEFGKTRRWANQLLEIARVIDEIESGKPFPASSGENKAILHNLNTRQVAELKGLAPEEKAKVFHLAVEAEGGKPPKPSTIANARSAAQLPPRRRSSFDPDPVEKNYKSAYSSAIDPADKIEKATPEDVVVARAVVLPTESTPEVFPQMFSFELHDQAEKDSFRVLAEKIIVKRNKKNGHPKIDMKDAIAKVCSAYKRVKGRTLSFKPADAAQLRRQLESGTTLEEFIAVGEKAWMAPSGGSFKLSKFSHQIAMFVKHFENIREEVSNPTGVDKNQIRETIHVRSL